MYLNQFVPDVFVIFAPHLHPLPLTDGQITLVRTVMLSSSCYHLPSEYETGSGVRSDVRKGTVSLTEYTPFSKHNYDTLTGVAAEFH